VIFAGLREVRPAPFPLTFEKVTALVTFRVVMLARVAVRFETVSRLVTFRVVRFAAPKRFEALRALKPAPFPLTFEALTVPILAVVAKILGVWMALLA
jgi:hypothetical protein